MPNSDLAGADVPFPSWEAWNRIRGLSPPDRELYESQKRLAADHITHRACVSCKQPFSDANCFTEDGWKETQLSGLCETCFDDAFAESGSDEEEPADVQTLDVQVSKLAIAEGDILVVKIENGRYQRGQLDSLTTAAKALREKLPFKNLVLVLDAGTDVTVLTRAALAIQAAELKT